MDALRNTFSTTVSRFSGFNGFSSKLPCVLETTKPKDEHDLEQIYLIVTKKRSEYRVQLNIARYSGELSVLHLKVIVLMMWMTRSDFQSREVKKRAGRLNSRKLCTVDCPES